MPTISGNGVQLYWEKTGEGATLVWVHEYGGDLRSWEPQVRYFSRRYRVITYNQRGYPPSTVPTAAHDYSQTLLVEDLHRLIAHLDGGPVHLGGCSMGANVARDFALAHPDALRSLILVGAGAGAVNREQFFQAQEATAASLERDGIAARVHAFNTVPTRATFKAKDPRGFAEFLRRYRKDPDWREWFEPLSEVVRSSKQRTGRQRLLLYGVVLHALVDDLDPGHEIVHDRPPYPNKLSKRGRRDLRYKVFPIYLPFVRQHRKYWHVAKE